MTQHVSEQKPVSFKSWVDLSDYGLTLRRALWADSKWLVLEGAPSRFEGLLPSLTKAGFVRLPKVVGDPTFRVAVPMAKVPNFAALASILPKTRTVTVPERPAWLRLIFPPDLVSAWSFWRARAESLGPDSEGRGVLCRIAFDGETDCRFLAMREQDGTNAFLMEGLAEEGSVRFLRCRNIEDEAAVAETAMRPVADALVAMLRDVGSEEAAEAERVWRRRVARLDARIMASMPRWFAEKPQAWRAICLDALAGQVFGELGRRPARHDAVEGLLARLRGVLSLPAAEDGETVIFADRVGATAGALTAQADPQGRTGASAAMFVPQAAWRRWSSILRLFGERRLYALPPESGEDGDEAVESALIRWIDDEVGDLVSSAGSGVLDLRSSSLGTEARWRVAARFAHAMGGRPVLALLTEDTTAERATEFFPESGFPENEDRESARALVCHCAVGLSMPGRGVAAVLLQSLPAAQARGLAGSATVVRAAAQSEEAWSVFRHALTVAADAWRTVLHRPEAQAELPSVLPYRPLTQATDAPSFAVPTALVGATERHLRELRARLGGVAPEEFVASKLGLDAGTLMQRLLPHQIDAVASALSSPTRSFLVGDQTGVGKGRVLAATIWAAVREGKRVLFLSALPANVMTTLARDLVSLGAFEDPVFVERCRAAGAAAAVLGGGQRRVESGSGIDVVSPDTTRATVAALRRGQWPSGTAPIIAGPYSQIAVSPKALASFLEAEREAFLAKMKGVTGQGIGLLASVRSLAQNGTGGDLVLVCDEVHAAGPNAERVLRALMASGAVSSFIAASATPGSDVDALLQTVGPMTGIRMHGILQALVQDSSLRNRVEAGVGSNAALLELTSAHLVSTSALVREHDPNSSASSGAVRVVRPDPDRIETIRDAADGMARVLFDVARLGAMLRRSASLYNESVAEQLRRRLEEAGGGESERIRSRRKSALDLNVDEGMDLLNPNRVSLSIYDLSRMFLSSLAVEDAVARGMQALQRGAKPVFVVDRTNDSILAELAELRRSKGDPIDELYGALLGERTAENRSRILRRGFGFEHLVAHRVVRMMKVLEDPRWQEHLEQSDSPTLIACDAIIARLRHMLASSFDEPLVRGTEAVTRCVREAATGLDEDEAARAQSQILAGLHAACARATSPPGAAEGELFLTPETLRMVDDSLPLPPQRLARRLGMLLDRLAPLFEGLSVSPLDELRQRIEEEARKAGLECRVGELTGRMYGLADEDDDADLAGGAVSLAEEAEEKPEDDGAKTIARRAAAETEQVVAAFQGGALDALIINRKAATGLDLHAHAGAEDKRERVVVVIDPPASPLVFAQLLGRFRRYGQLSPTDVEILSLGLPMQDRLHQMLLRHVGAMSAAAAGDRSARFEINEYDTSSALDIDVLSATADRVAAAYLARHADLARMIGLNNIGDGADRRSHWGGASSTDGLANRFLLRLTALPLTQQEKVYGEFVEEVRAAYATSSALASSAFLRSGRGLPKVTAEHEVLSAQVFPQLGVVLQRVLYRAPTDGMSWREVNALLEPARLHKGTADAEAALAALAAQARQERNALLARAGRGNRSVQDIEGKARLLEALDEAASRLRVGSIIRTEAEGVANFAVVIGLEPPQADISGLMARLRSFRVRLVSAGAPSPISLSLEDFVSSAAVVDRATIYAPGTLDDMVRNAVAQTFDRLRRGNVAPLEVAVLRGEPGAVLQAVVRVASVTQGHGRGTHAFGLRGQWAVLAPLTRDGDRMVDRSEVAHAFIASAREYAFLRDVLELTIGRNVRDPENPRVENERAASFGMDECAGILLRPGWRRVLDTRMDRTRWQLGTSFVYPAVMLSGIGDGNTLEVCIDTSALPILGLLTRRNVAEALRRVASESWYDKDGSRFVCLGYEDNRAFLAEVAGFLRALGEADPSLRLVDLGSTVTRISPSRRQTRSKDTVIERAVVRVLNEVEGAFDDDDSEPESRRSTRAMSARRRSTRAASALS